MLFFVKVRIDVNKLAELGQKLQRGELDKRNLKSTYCIESDPSVGLNIWEAEDLKDFETKFAPHKKYYADVMEITPVITPTEAQDLLRKQLSEKQ